MPNSKLTYARALLTDISITAGLPDARFGVIRHFMSRLDYLLVLYQKQGISITQIHRTPWKAPCLLSVLNCVVYRLQINERVAVQTVAMALGLKLIDLANATPAA